MTTDSPTLAPCPFCGEALIVSRSKLAAHRQHSDCLLKANAVDIDNPDQVAAWNRRPDRSPAGEVRVISNPNPSADWAKAALSPAPAPEAQPHVCELHADFLGRCSLCGAEPASVRPAPAPEREGPQWDSRAYRLGYASGRSGRTPEVDALVEALRWYEGLVRDCRKVHAEGERARHTLEKDQGSTARAALAAYEGGKDG